MRCRRRYTAVNDPVRRIAYRRGWRRTSAQEHVMAFFMDIPIPCSQGQQTRQPRSSPVKSGGLRGHWAGLNLPGAGSAISPSGCEGARDRPEQWTAVDPGLAMSLLLRARLQQFRGQVSRQRSYRRSVIKYDANGPIPRADATLPSAGKIRRFLPLLRSIRVPKKISHQ